MSNEKSVAVFTNTTALPAHLQNGAGLGNENVGGDDVSIARLDLLQMLSPQLQEDNAAYLQGAKVGQLFDTISGELYEKAFVVNLKFDVSFSAFKKRALGNDFQGMHDSEAAAIDHLNRSGLNPADYDIAETHIHTCMLLDAKGNPRKPVRIFMSGSKLKVSKSWNSSILLHNQGADRFASAWIVSSVKEKNKQGQPYQNYRLEFAGFVNESLYAEAKKNYLALSGQAQQ